MQYFCFMWLNATSGAVRVARFSQQNPPNCYSNLAQSHFEGGSPDPGKVPGSKYLGTWQHSAQTQATSLPQAPLAALFRRRQQTKLSTTQRKGPMAGFIWLQFTINTSNRHTFYLHVLVCYCSSSIQAPCFSLLNLNVNVIYFFLALSCDAILFYFIVFIYLNLCVCTSNMFGW